MSEVGVAFAEALAAKDAEALSGLLTKDVDFKGLTPRRFWEGGSPADVLEVLFGNWFEPKDEIKSLMSCESGAVGSRESVTYRLHITDPDGQYEVEQRAYFDVVDGRIGYLRILCSGYVPVPAG
jgi:hypothetical protein